MDLLYDHFNGIKLLNFVKTEETIFERIDEILAKNQYIYLYGRSGSGKTTLAREYAYFKKLQQQQQVEKKYSIQFIDCGPSLKTNLNKLKDQLNIADVQVEAGIDQDKMQLDLVKRRINNFENKAFIFIFDNVVNLADVEKLLYNINQEHMFIITSKNQQLFPNTTIGIEVNAFDEKKCLEYLEKNEMRHELSAEKWRELLMGNKNKEIVILPKTLELLINNWKNHPLWGFGKLKKFLLNESNKRYELVKEENGLVYEILKHLAFLNGSCIDLNLVNDLVNCDGLIDDDEIEEAINYLLKNTYLKKKKIENMIYEIHETTQNEIREILNETEKDLILNKIVDVLNSKLEIGTNERLQDQIFDKNKLQKTSENTLTVLNHTWANKYNSQCYIDLLRNLANANRNVLFNYDIVKSFLFELVRIFKNSSNNISLADTLEDIGNIYVKTREFNEAFKYYKESMEIRRQCLPATHVSIGEILIKIAVVLLNKKDFDDGLNFFKESLDFIKNNISNSNGLSILKSLETIEWMHDNERVVEKGQIYLTELLEIMKQHLPENDPSIACTLKSIGDFFSDKSEYDAAFITYNESLRIMRINNEADFTLSNLLNNMGLAYCFGIKDYDLALCHYKESLGIRKQILPSNHSSIGKSLNNIGVVYWRKNDFDEAANYFKESLEIKRLSLPLNHISISFSLMNIGKVYLKKKDFYEALKYFNEALDIKKKNFSLNHPDIGDVTFKIGCIYYDLDQLDNALEHCENSLKIFQSILQPKTNLFAITTYTDLIEENLKTIDNIRQRLEGKYSGGTGTEISVNLRNIT